MFHHQISLEQDVGHMVVTGHVVMTDALAMRHADYFFLLASLHREVAVAH